MRKSCFITLLVSLFSPVCGVFAAPAPEIQARWNKHVSFGNRAQTQEFVARANPGLVFAKLNEKDEKRLLALITIVDRATE